MVDTEMVLDVRILLPAALLLLLLSTVVAANRPVAQEMAAYPMEVQVTDDDTNISLGISVDGDTIDFGVLPVRAMRAEKEITVENNEAYPTTMVMEMTGNISDHVTVTPSSVDLSAGGEQTVAVEISTTNITTPGYYGGTLQVVEEKPVWRWLWTHR